MSRAYRFKYAAFAVVLALSLQIQAGADVPSTGLTVSQQLANIENQLFEHSYANDNEEARLARLELFVFGVKSATSSGSSLQARLNRIERVVVTDPDGNPATPYVQPVVSIGGTAMPPKAPPIAVPVRASEPLQPAT